MKLRVTPSGTKRTVDGPKRDELSRTGRVLNWDFELSTHGADGRFYEARSGAAVLIARGEFTEAVKDVSAFELTFIGKDAKQVESAHAVGIFMRAKPVLEGVIYLTWHELGALVPLATLNREMLVNMRFQRPRYGSAEIHSFGLSTRTSVDSD